MAVRSKKTTNEKIIKSVIILLLSVLPIWGDEILGQIYFYKICKEKAGINIFKTIQLDDKYWNENNEPIFLVSGEFDSSIFNNKYSVLRKKNTKYNTMFNIIKLDASVINISTNEILGNVTRFAYFGGWFVKHSGFYNKGKVCPVEYGFTEKMIKQVFVKK